MMAYHRLTPGGPDEAHQNEKIGIEINNSFSTKQFLSPEDFHEAIIKKFVVKVSEFLSDLKDLDE